MGIIHMDTEIVQDFAVRTMQRIYENQDEIYRIERMVKDIPWSGQNRDSFVENCHNLIEQVVDSNTQSYNLVKRVIRESDGWIAMDHQNAARYVTQRSQIAVIAIGIGKMAEEIARSVTNTEAKRKFTEWWKTLSVEERKKYLEDVYLKICKELGLEPVDFSIKDLPEKGLLGHYINDRKLIEIDLQNFENSSPFDLVNTVAHEARHQYQNQCVRFFEETGKPPEGVTLDEVQGWKYNDEHYIDGNKDFGGYYVQSNEIDSRNYGANYATQTTMDFAAGGGGGAG
jgi:hypothetical protein